MKHVYTEQQFGEEWFTYPQLYTKMVNKFPSNSKFVEIGCWKGKSSAYMMTEIINSEKNIEFTCIDVWEDNAIQSHPTNNLYNVFKKNMTPFENKYRSLRMKSVDASKLFADNSLDFVFIDASHEYEDVKQDIISWGPKLKISGILAGHDYWPDTWGGVKKAVDELLTHVTISTDEGCWIYNK